MCNMIARIPFCYYFLSPLYGIWHQVLLFIDQYTTTTNKLTQKWPRILRRIVSGTQSYRHAAILYHPHNSFAFNLYEII